MRLLNFIELDVLVGESILKLRNLLSFYQEMKNYIIQNKEYDSFRYERDFIQENEKIRF